jgi:TPP-dependent pyruvate/acetoin dehydrogenase alpha subunit
VLEQAALAALEAEVAGELKDALAFARAAPEPALATVFDHLYASPCGATPELR